MSAGKSTAKCTIINYLRIHVKEIDSYALESISSLRKCISLAFVKVSETANSD